MLAILYTRSNLSKAAFEVAFDPASIQRILCRGSNVCFRSALKHFWMLRGRNQATRRFIASQYLLSRGEEQLRLGSKQKCWLEGQRYKLLLLTCYCS